MPQRASKILLLRITANKNALLFQIRVTCFARYTMWFGVTSCDQNAVNDYNDHNANFLVTLCITIRDEHGALFD